MKQTYNRTNRARKAFLLIFALILSVFAVLNASTVHAYLGYTSFSTSPPYQVTSGLNWGNSQVRQYSTPYMATVAFRNVPGYDTRQYTGTGRSSPLISNTYQPSYYGSYYQQPYRQSQFAASGYDTYNKRTTYVSEYFSPQYQSKYHSYNDYHSYSSTVNSRSNYVHYPYSKYNYIFSGNFRSYEYRILSH